MMNIIKMIVVNLELFRQFMETTLVSFYHKIFYKWKKFDFSILTE